MLTIYNKKLFWNFLILILLTIITVIFSDTTINLWLFFYSLEWIVVIIAAIAAPFLGFTGFFWLTAVIGLCTTTTLLIKLSDFFSYSTVITLNTGPVAKLGSSEIGLSLYIDTIGYSFGLLTALIGSCVYFYAFSYMRFEKNILNFLIFFEVFKLSMMLLVWANSWFTLILGWELIGASSFLLINFWTTKITTLKSAFKALSFNKLSDAALISAACISLWFGCYTIQSVSQTGAILASKNIFIGHYSISTNDLFLICISIASFCKSAQLGFHFWLPDSMEAPVPASALIHSATLVSAGIYLVLRFNFCFYNSPHLILPFQLLTSMTAFYGAVIASFQTDVKKLLAYSTISHCGMLMYSITLFRPDITIFYLFAHGFFKSLNFLCVGNFIQYANNYQDVSRMGMFGVNYRFESFFLFITTFNLSSAPLFIAFFSKHWLINLSEGHQFLSIITTGFIFSAAFCGFFYSAKLFCESIFAKKRAHRLVYLERALIIDSTNLTRRANFIGISSMCVLFAIAIFVLTMLFMQFSTELVWGGDVWMSAPAQNITQYQLAVLLAFSQLLAGITLSYISFKRFQTKIIIYIVIVTCLITLSIF